MIPNDASVHFKPLLDYYKPIHLLIIVCHAQQLCTFVDVVQAFFCGGAEQGWRGISAHPMSLRLHPRL